MPAELLSGTTLLVQDLPMVIYFFLLCFGWALVGGSSYVMEQGFRFQGPTITLSMRHLPYCAWYRHELSLLHVFLGNLVLLPMINVGWE